MTKTLKDYGYENFGQVESGAGKGQNINDWDYNTRILNRK